MKISTIGIVGAGQMGSGIAQVCAMSGYNAVLWDINNDASEKAVKNIASQLNKMVEKEKITAQQAKDTISRIKKVSDLKDFSTSDLIIEAATENVDLKLKLFTQLDSIVPKDGYLTSNTSSISITRIAAATKRPERVMGVHFMNPPPVMKLVELIRGLQTSEETYSTIKSTIDSMGKTTVLAIDSAGFIVNRILVPMINEAIFLVQEGVAPEDIDQAMKLGTNQPMGPLTLADFVGLDTCLFILQVLHRELGEDKFRPCPLLVKYVEAGWYGKKVGRGFYKYES